MRREGGGRWRWVAVAVDRGLVAGGSGGARVPGAKRSSEIGPKPNPCPKSDHVTRHGCVRGRGGGIGRATSGRSWKTRGAAKVGRADGFARARRAGLQRPRYGGKSTQLAGRSALNGQTRSHGSGGTDGVLWTNGNRTLFLRKMSWLINGPQTVAKLDTARATRLAIVLTVPAEHRANRASSQPANMMYVEHDARRTAGRR